MFPLLNSRHLSVSFTFLCSFTEWTSVHLCLQTCGHTRAHQCPFRQSLCCLSMLTMHVLLCTSYFQHAGTPLQLLPSTPSTSPPAYSLPRGPSMPTYLWRSHPMRGGCMVDKHQWGNFFIAIKLLRTVCRVALSVGPGLLEESNSPERERERERGQRERKCERTGGCQFLILIPLFKKVVGRIPHHLFYVSVFGQL